MKTYKVLLIAALACMELSAFATDNEKAQKINALDENASENILNNVVGVKFLKNGLKDHTYKAIEMLASDGVNPVRIYIASEYYHMVARVWNTDIPVESLKSMKKCNDTTVLITVTQTDVANDSSPGIFPIVVKNYLLSHTFDPNNGDPLINKEMTVKELKTATCPAIK